MSRVFVVQQPAYFDTSRRGWVNKYDLSPAREHGKLVFLLRPSNIPKTLLAETIEHLHKALADFSTDDHLMAVGDPIAIAASVLVAGSKTGGIVSMLKWDRFQGVYEPYVVDITCNNGSTKDDPAAL